MRTPAIVILALALASCADTHNVRRSGNSAAALDPTAIAYVAVPMDGRFGQTVYANSGRITAAKVTRAFSPYLAITTQGEHPESKEKALQKAKTEGYTYLIFPEILHWEDRATEWSGLPDQISVELSIVDVANGSVLDSARIDGKSKFMTFGGDHPEDLLEKPLTDYARSLFQ